MEAGWGETWRRCGEMWFRPGDGLFGGGVRMERPLYVEEHEDGTRDAIFTRVTSRHYGREWEEYAGGRLLATKARRSING
ncbi:hypothetical protein E4U43_002508 [Claviceps pusilla]|uniref:Uncharacterized protein n=1 Tax=Claviceps pusilla TaxID=123648 RepID=A0A9P7SV78_9HYPO|nr:hypothetical protein E4U43_002508 [Claviceps pusilla]